MAYLNRALFTCLVLATLVALPFGNLLADSSFTSLPEGKFQEIKAKARTLHKPFLLYFYQEDSRDCKRLEKKTWADDSLMQFLSEGFLTQQHQILTTDVELIQQFKVFSSPTIIIFSPDAKMMGRVEGFVESKTFYSILEKHLKVLEKREVVSPPQLYTANSKADSTKPTQAMAELALANKENKEPLSLSITDIADSHMRLAARGDRLNSIQMTVAEMEPYSLTKLPQDEHAYYGMLIGSFPSLKRLKQEFREAQRFWKGKIWVYAEKVEQTTVYKLALGAYDDQSKAKSFAKAMNRFEKMEATVINLSKLIEIE